MARARLAPPAASRARPPSVARASGKRMMSQDRMLAVFVAWAGERWPAEYARNSRPIPSLAVRGFPSFREGLEFLIGSRRDWNTTFESLRYSRWHLESRGFKSRARF